MKAFDTSLSGRDLTVPLPDGRVIGVREYGAPDGVSWILLHGTPGSRLMFAPAHAAAVALGLRLICPERPGFGLSSAQPNRTLESFAADLACVADHLDLADPALFGVSGGAPYAVVAAARLQQRISRLAIVSPMGPIADFAGQVPVHWGQRLFFLGLGQHRGLARVVAGWAVRRFLAAPQKFHRAFAQSLGEPDRSTLLRPDVATHVERDVRMCLSQGVEAALQDLYLFGRPWGTSFGDVRQPVTMWQGTSDKVVPMHVAFALARALPRVELRTIEGGGHFWIYDNIPAVLETMQRPPAA